MLDLRRPIYKQTAAYGHFGRTDVDLSWERTDSSSKLAYMKKALRGERKAFIKYVGIKRRVQCHANCHCGI